MITSYRMQKNFLYLSVSIKKYSKLVLLVSMLLNHFMFTKLYAANGSNKKLAPGRILVQPMAGLSKNKFSTILAKIGGKSFAKIKAINLHLVSVPVGQEIALSKGLSHHPAIEFAEVDEQLALTEFIPNDPDYSSQWHLPKINTQFAWPDSMGDGVVVAILDTGVNASHPDLAANMLPGYNSADGSFITTDANGHGTAVAGTVGAAFNNSVGVASVAPNVQIIPIRVTNRSDGYASFSDIARGLTWAADNGAKVANISYVASVSSAVTSSAEYFKSKGGVVVSSAGNSGTEATAADNPHIITVSASDSSDQITSWSSFGNFVDVIAPGSNIRTTTSSGGYGNWSGTSFSSPVVAGVVALIMAANSALAPDQVEMILESSAKDLGTLGWDKRFGHGRVDSAAAVLQALNTIIEVDITAPVVTHSLVVQEEVSGLVTINATASDNIAVAKLDLYINDQFVGTDNSAPFQFAWDTLQVSNGSSNVKVIAYDTSNNSAEYAVDVIVSNTVVVDTTSPQVQILSPSDGAILSGSQKIDITGSDNINVSQLACYLDGVLLSQVFDSNNITCNFNTRKSSSGQHTITAKATDAAGNTTSSSIGVVVEKTKRGRK